MTEMDPIVGQVWCKTNVQMFVSNILTLIAERFERRAIGITSNLVFSQRGDFPEPHGHRRVALTGWYITPWLWMSMCPATGPEKPKAAGRTKLTTATPTGGEEAMAIVVRRQE